MRHQWCQPGNVAKRRWLLMFEDPDRGPVIYTDETSARAAFEEANVAWNCYLFVVAERKADA